MKRLRRADQAAFTVVELIAIFTMILLFAAMLLPALARTKLPSLRLNCSNNLKQIGVAFNTWAPDHGDAFPMRVAAANGGYADFVGTRTVSNAQNTSRGVFGFFLVMSNELSEPKGLICPAENEARLQSTTFTGVILPDPTNGVPFTNDLNTSYFVGVDATQANPKMLLAGDHNLGADGNLTPLRAFATATSFYSPDFKVSLGTNFTLNAGVGWLDTMHLKQGNVVLADGSVQQYNRGQLQDALHNSGDKLGGFGPNFPLSSGCFGSGLNRVQFP